jgi:hypothetical protein
MGGELKKTRSVMKKVAHSHETAPVEEQAAAEPDEDAEASGPESDGSDDNTAAGTSTHAGKPRKCKLCNESSISKFPFKILTSSLKKLHTAWGGLRPWLHFKLCKAAGVRLPSGTYCLICFYVWRQTGANLKYRTLKAYMKHIKKDSLGWDSSIVKSTFHVSNDMRPCK